MNAKEAPLRVVRLRAENVMRLEAVDISPDPGAAAIVIGGRNGAGKSSVLNAIAMAIGGQALAPPEPIRAGEAEAEAMADLGDLVVTRRWRRERAECDCAASRNPDSVCEAGCASRTKWGPTRTTLTVSNREGTARYNSPQAILDSFRGRLSFDPLDFARLAREKPAEAGELLRRAVGLDLEAIDRRRADAYAERTRTNREAAQAATLAGAMPRHEGIGAEEESLAAIAMELDAAMEKERLAVEARKAEDVAERELADILSRDNEARADVERAEAALRHAQAAVEAARKAVDDWAPAVRAAELARDRATAAAEQARAEVPEPAPIRDRLRAGEARNAKARANKAKAQAEAHAQNLASQAAALTEAIQACDAERAAAIAAAPFPVEGLGLDGDGSPTLNGLPLAQASSSEQLRVGAELGAALNPRLRVMLVRNGNLLDDDGLRALTASAARLGMQLWIEWVASGPDGRVSVTIEDGRVAERDTMPAGEL